MLFKREREVNETILKLIDNIDQCLSMAQQSIQEYFKPNIGEAKALAIRVDQIETEADNTRRQIISMLFLGAYFPSLREDIIRFVQELDKIADAAESCCDFILGQRPNIPDSMKSDFNRIFQNSISTFAPLKDAIRLFFLEKGDIINSLREKIKQVSIIESAVDKEEWDLTRTVFETPLDYGHKIHLRSCIEHMVEVSDRAEDACDELEIIIIKGSV